MNLQLFYQFVERYRERIILPVMVIVLFITGLFFIDDLWLGWVARTHLCPPPATSCSLAESMGYISTVHSSGSTLDEQYLAERTSLELGSLMEVIRTRPALAPYAQDLNAALTKVKSQITSAVAADEKVYSLLQQPSINAVDMDFVTHRIRLALVEQMEIYLKDAIQKENTALEESLMAILPDEATSISLTKRFEDRATNYMRPGERFLIEKVQVEGTRSEGNIFDTVSVSITVQGTAEALERFLADINTSGSLEAPDKSLPLMRLTQLNITGMGSTTPESSIDTPRPVYRGDLRLETYIRALTAESLEPLRQEMTQLREKAKNLQMTALLRPGADMQKITQLFDLANNSERTLEAAEAQPTKDLRAIQDQLTTLKELYQTIIGHYTAA